MAKYLDWYLVELEGRLQHKMRADEVHDFVAQAESHLIDSAEQMRANGMSERESELSAIERFGRVRKIADAALARKSPQRIAGQVAMLVAFTAFGIAFVPASLAEVQVSGISNGWLTFWAALFCLSAMFGRRILGREMVLIASVGCIVLAVVYGINFTNDKGSSRAAIRSQLKALEAVYPLLPARIADLDSRSHQFALATHGPYTYPLGLDPGHDHLTTVEYGATNSRELAAARWKMSLTIGEELQSSYDAMGREAEHLREELETSMWTSARTHLLASSGLSLVWLASGLVLNFLFSSIPGLLTSRSPVHSKYA